MAKYRGVQVVSDYFNGSRVIPTKEVDPDLEVHLREEHATLQKAIDEFPDGAILTPEGMRVWDAVVGKLADFEIMCEEKYGLDLERKWWEDPSILDSLLKARAERVR